MDKRLLFIFFFLLSLAVVITTCGGGGGGGSGSGGTSTTPGSSGNGTQADSTSIPILLKQYRDEIYPTLPVDKRTEVENYASGYPVEVSGNAEPVVVQSNGTPPQLTTVINRRDWAYAEKGIRYTFIGVFAVGQEKMLDLALWCFLEAALLHPDEPEHLSNVAFYLNERGKNADARKLLLHALSFDDKNTVALNNLAYASAALGDYSSAVTYSLVAMCQDQGVSLILERLRYYAEAGGYDLIAQMADATLTNPLYNKMDENTDWISQLSSNGKDVWVEIQKEWDRESAAGHSCHEEYESVMAKVVILNQQQLDLRIQMNECGKSIDPLTAFFNPYAFCDICAIPAVSKAPSLEVQKITIEAKGLAGRRECQMRVFREGAARLEIMTDRAELTPLDRMLLRTYWLGYLLVWPNGVIRDCGQQMQILSEAQAHVRETVLRDPTYLDPGGFGDVRYCFEPRPSSEELLANAIKAAINDPSAIRVSDWLRSFSGNISLPLGIMTLDISRREGTIEATFGEGVQYTVGWNLKKKLLIVGIGYCINLGNIFNVGAMVKYNPSNGLTGVVELGQAEPVPIFYPGGDYGPPRIQIAKVGRFAN